MVAATRIITQDDALNSALKKKRRGRPTVLETRELVAGAQRRQSYRQAVNEKYSATGAALIMLAKGEDYFDSVFLDAHRNFKYAGVLEQIGRFYRDNDTFTKDEVDEVIEIALDEIGKGNKSKEIEKTLRQMRKLLILSRKKGR